MRSRRSRRSRRNRKLSHTQTSVPCGTLNNTFKQSTVAAKVFKLQTVTDLLKSENLEVAIV